MNSDRMDLVPMIMRAGCLEIVWVTTARRLIPRRTEDLTRAPFSLWLAARRCLCSHGTPVEGMS
jgi:hypothetical protein